MTNDLAIAGLYISLLQRAPEADGFSFWVQALNNGSSREAVAQSMLGAPEVLGAQASTQTSAQFVTQFYTNMLGRAPDASGLAFWSSVLENLGGAANVGARAALVLQITDVLATPLSTQPADVSSQDYQRSVADRALFANKVEFGVFFASQLKSNDMALAKSALALVTSDPASIQAASNLAQGIVEPEPPVVTPPITPPVITAADTAVDIARKFAPYSGNAATVDAAGMAADQLEAVGNVVNKIGSLSNLTLVLADVTDATVSALLPKALADSVAINATAATAAALSIVSANLAKIAIDGITGDLAFTREQSGFMTTTLLNKTSMTANVTADVSGMDRSQLSSLSWFIDKVDSITNLKLELANPDHRFTYNLLSKAVPGTVEINATGRVNEQLFVILNNLDKIVTNGITGDWSMTNSFQIEHLVTLLSEKLDLSANVTVDATGMDMTQLEVVGLHIAKVDTLTNLRQLDLQLLSDTATENLLSKSPGNTYVDTTGASADELSSLATHIDKIADSGITGTLTLNSTQTAEVLTALLGGKTGDATASVTVDASGMNMAQLEALAGGNSKIDSLVNLPPLELAGLSETATLYWMTQTLATAPLAIVATGATNGQLSSVSFYNNRVMADGITGDLVLNRSHIEAMISNLLSKASAAANVTVNASAMSVDQLNLVGSTAAIAKVDSITNLQFAISAFSSATASNLLSKAAMGTALVHADSQPTGDQLTVLSTHIGNIATNGITGSLSLTNDQSASDLTILLGDKTSAAAAVTINASSMTVDKLIAVGGGIAKVDAITSLNFRLQDVADNTTSALLSKSQANTVRIDVNGGSTAEATTVLGNLGKIANGGLSGLLEVSYANLDAGINTMLSSKIAQFSSLEVTGTAGREIMSFPGLTTGSINLRINPAGGGDLINLGNSSATILIADRDTVRSGNLSVNNTTTENLLHVEGTGFLNLHFSTQANAFGDGLAFQHGAVSNYDSNKVTAVGNQFSTLGDVVASANAAYLSGPLGGSTNQTPVLYTFEIEGGDGLNGKFLFLNDNDTILTIDDMIMSYAVSNLAISFVTF
ncbi:DUF4214 domain-containing protein [Pigmentiphaga aceris]|nr:DUF4214 domain-containing protein [Pigmentiphaga aceris]